MPNPTSIPDITDDWQQLLGAYTANAGELQSVEPLSQLLRGVGGECRRNHHRCRMTHRVVAPR